MRKVIIGMSLLLAVTSAFSLVTLKELRDERARSAALQEELEHSRSQRAKTASFSSTQSDDLPASISTLAPNTPVDRPPAPALDEFQEHRLREQRLLKDPAYREAWRAQRRAHSSSRRDQVIRLLGFTPEQADAIVELSIDRDLLTEYARPPVAEAADAAQAERFQKDLREIDDKMRDVLGEEKYERLERYVASSNSRRRVDEFRNSLPGSERLNDSQTEQLIAAIHVHQMQFRTELDERSAALADMQDRESMGNLWREFYAQRLQAAHDRMRPEAAAFLTPAQMARFEDMMNRERMDNEISQAMARLQLENELRESTD